MREIATISAPLLFDEVKFFNIFFKQNSNQKLMKEVNYLSQKLLGMSYTELNHLKEKDPEVAKTYHHLINKLYTLGPSKLSRRK